MRPTAKYAFSAVRRLTQHCKQLLRVDRETILDHRASGINHDKPWGAAGTVIHHGRGIATVRRDCVVTEGNPQAVLRLVVAEPIGRVHLHTLEDGLDDGEAEFSCLFRRSEEHTSELQSLMRISSAVFCLKKK